MLQSTTPQELASALSEAHASLIAIDGNHGSGKSTLAAAIQELLGASLVSFDNFLAVGQESYFRNLDLQSIIAAASTSRPCILDGICMFQVLEATSLLPDAFVYVKRMAKWGWADQDELVVSGGSLEEHLAALSAQAKTFTTTGEGLSLGLSEEVIRYHALYLPHKRAGYVFNRHVA
ncbi:chloramphenicol 3-O-phosphotransferase [Actimicrobium sp. GrIS 1.19]|uniref:hypothetical protein n=1 Tax=Actimicrobium sp. GrIS 1.19 TaxID=3071708 RepID=UPI002DF99103|nr:chloramphenicol 3-O-phosphotransferase [Actimicrobium sp. GrIS 1.19]